MGFSIGLCIALYFEIYCVRKWCVIDVWTAWNWKQGWFKLSHFTASGMEMQSLTRMEVICARAHVAGALQHKHSMWYVEIEGTCHRYENLSKNIQYYK